MFLDVSVHITYREILSQHVLTYFRFLHVFRKEWSIPFPTPFFSHRCFFIYLFFLPIITFITSLLITYLFILFYYLSHYSHHSLLLSFYYSIKSQRPPSLQRCATIRVPQTEREQRSANQRWVTLIDWREGVGLLLLVKASVVVILFLTLFSSYFVLPICHNAFRPIFSLFPVFSLPSCFLPSFLSLLPL